MKKYKNRTLSDTVSTIGSMLLFLVFAVCLLMMIAVAAGTYSRISSGFNKTFGSSASLRYISNKIKSSERLEIAENGSALLLRNGGMIDVIYFENDGLYEKSIAADDVPDIGGGDRIFELNEMNVSDMGDLYKITVAFGEEENSTFVRKG